jgi:hypothetical protein
MHTKVSNISSKKQNQQQVIFRGMITTTVVVTYVMVLASATSAGSNLHFKTFCQLWGKALASIIIQNMGEEDDGLHN